MAMAVREVNGARGGYHLGSKILPGHEYMGTVVALGEGVDEYAIGERVTVEIHAGCGQCKRCRQGMHASCHNYGMNYGDVNKGHRANGFTTDGVSVNTRSTASTRW